MTLDPAPDDAQDAQALSELVGYLNFSSGSPDPKFLADVNGLFRSLEKTVPRQSSWRVLMGWIEATIARLEAAGGAFGDTRQARAVLALARDHALPAYRSFHSDLLYHQSESDLWRPLFIGKVFEALLQQGPPWDEAERIAAGAVASLNDYIGYRPIPQLESGARGEAYSHEFVRPIPLYLKGVGVSVGPYTELVGRAMEVLRRADQDILGRAWFGLDRLEEIALDPRAYDFDHPVNRRPNYHFGQWDPYQISKDGYYTRFVLQQITLDALTARCNELDTEQARFEAAAVLAGTMLMASGTCGDGPDRHDSETTLATLLPHIAAYRDDFYDQLLRDADGEVGEALRAEAIRHHQPFGGARQHLNHELARRRAIQLQRVHLAQLFARMGYPEAAVRQANLVRVPSARMLSEIYCRLTAGHDAIDSNRPDGVIENLVEIEDLLMRAIRCGALVDPWNVVGFGGNFSLFPALENTVHDWRVDELIELVEQVLDLCARGRSEAAAIDNAEAENAVSEILSRIAAWWDQFATSSVDNVKRLVAKEVEVSANLVAGALNAWHKAGAAAGDIAFWRMFVDQFDSSKSFQLVIEGLLDHGDTVASSALMMQWVSQKDRTPLEEGDSSFHRLAHQWLSCVEQKQADTDQDLWPEVERFFTHLEANAEEYWEAPVFELGDAESPPLDDRPTGAAEPGGSATDDSGLFDAAYDEMVYRDSTDDGVEGDTAGGDGYHDPQHEEWETEVDRLELRLEFLTTVGRLWKQAATTWGPAGAGGDASAADGGVFDEWLRRASLNESQLLDLLETVDRYRLTPPTGTHESLVEFDRLRTIKEALVQRIITTCVETLDAARLLRAIARPGSAAEAEEPAIALLTQVLTGDAAGFRLCWPRFVSWLTPKRMLYIPHSRGGKPREIVATRGLQQLLHDLLGWMPRLGLIRETCDLLQLAQELETQNPVGQGAVTEFDRLFENGYQSVVRAMVSSADQWRHEGQGPQLPPDHLLVEALQQLTEQELNRWLNHSKTLRLSIVETLGDEKAWQAFVAFIKQYGGQIFDQRFLSLGNLRGIMHQGVEHWLESLAQDPDAAENLLLLADLESGEAGSAEIEMLELAIECVVENYRVYRDYNTTTTQSDHGERLYCLVDFLRLRANYDRVAWNLKPVVWAHEILVRHGRSVAAEMWCQAFRERTHDVADRHLAELARLSDDYGMRLATVSDRLKERFIRPLVIDRVKALVGPAMFGDPDSRLRAYQALENEISGLASEPCGAGLDLPDWLAALEDEVAEARSRRNHLPAIDRLSGRLGQASLTWPELLEQLKEE